MAEASNDEGAAEQQVWRPLSPSTVAIWRVQATLWVGAFVVVLIALWFLARAVEPGLPDRLGTWKLVAARSTVIDVIQTGIVAAAGLTIVAWVIAIVVAPARYAYAGWRLTEDSIEIRSGWWRRRREQAPIALAHTVVISDGPVLRHWGAQRVRVYAAGSVGTMRLAAIDPAHISELTSRLGFAESEPQ